MSIKKHIVYFFLLMCFFYNILNPAYTLASAPKQTEKSLSRTIMKSHKAARRKKWSLAIKYAERALVISPHFHQMTDPFYINQLRVLNQYYDKAGRLSEIPTRIETAYKLSKENLRNDHKSARINRQLYYKLLISQHHFNSAIPLVLENIAALSNARDDQFTKLHHLKQLYALYGLTQQLKRQETRLLEFIKLNIKLVGLKDDDTVKARKILAKNYCRQHKIIKFKALNSEYNLSLQCKSST
jgi:hypothetical protein